MSGRKEEFRQTAGEMEAILTVSEDKLRERRFSTDWGDESEFPEDEQLRSFEMTFSLLDIEFPLELVRRCKPYSRPGIRIKKQLKDARNPSKGWKGVMERVVLYDGGVDEQMGSYEWLDIDLTTGSYKAHNRNVVALKERREPRDVYLSMIRDLAGFDYLVSASFVERASGVEFKLSPR